MDDDDDGMEWMMMRMMIVLMMMMMDADDRLINASRSLLTVSQHFTCRKVAISMACERRFSRSR